MPVNLTETSTFTSPVQVPDAGDPVSAGGGSYLRGALQALANRSKFLNDILTSTGITKVRVVANTTALKALASPAVGDVAVLNSGIPQFYLFRSIALAGSDITGARYDSTVAIGQWVSPWLYLADLSGASPRLDVQTLPPPNRIVSIAEDAQALGVSAQNATDAGGVFGPTLNISVETGDLVILEGHTTFAAQNAEATGRVSLTVDGTEVEASKRLWSALGSPYLFVGPLTPSGLYTAAATGTIVVRLYQIRTTNVSGTPQFIGPRSLRATVIRP